MHRVATPDRPCTTVDPLTALADAHVRAAARRCLAAGHTPDQVADTIGVTVAGLWQALGRRQRQAR